MMTIYLVNIFPWAPLGVKISQFFFFNFSLPLQDFNGTED